MVGNGRPLQVLKKGRSVPIHDGGGLCSPGRWPMERINLPAAPAGQRLRRILVEFLTDTTKETNIELKQLWFKLAAGKATVSPFPNLLVQEHQLKLATHLQYHYTVAPRSPTDRKSQTLAGALEVSRGSGG